MYRAYTRKPAFLDKMMEGMPISSVAPQGTFCCGSDPEDSRIVSDELLHLSVDELVEETTLDCFSCDTTDTVFDSSHFGFALIVPPAPFSSCPAAGRGLTPTFAGVDGLEGGVPEGVRTTDFLVASTSSRSSSAHR
ncbi:hypothetical protein ONZ51_g12765 [Trametes cubensis]|uniref:Uncharacterized protein n=1 Tax=Trametes cubensis TaxID=1111947 RepID=A0AAD7X3E4_9APHY|nr:hypothetical protein ONZ51_g12765 [Trametes cubensis]